MSTLASQPAAPRWLLPIARPVLGHRVTVVPLLAAFVLLGAAISLAVSGGWWWLIPVGLVAPDLTFLAGLSDTPPAPGVMPRRAVPFYNAAHRAVPAALAVVGAAAFGWQAGLIVTIAWLSHIVWDRAVGYGLRLADGNIADPFVLHRCQRRALA